jgi:hypothetical protein
MNRKALLIAVACTVAAFLSACSKSTPPAITISTAPPATLEINNSASIAATVTHDSHNEGVDWTCSPSPCGTFNPTHTASGASTVYTAPSTAGAVTITADATVKPAVTATASVTVNAVATAASLTGNYAFYANGFDAVGDFYTAAGVVVLDGAGNVAAGSEEDLNNASTGSSAGDTLLGTYTVNADGQGTMILNATSLATSMPDPNVGVAGVQTLSFVVVNSNHMLITEFDAAATSSGSMDFQTAAAITSGFAGNYALTTAGFVSGTPTVLGGVVNATGLVLTGTGDLDEAGSFSPGGVLGSSVAAADASGRGTAVIAGADFTYYVVGTEALYLVCTDNGIVLAGPAIGQGTTTFAAANVTGPYVIDEQWPYSESAFGPIALAGQFTADGLGTSATSLNGVTDYNEGGFVDPGAPDTFQASFVVAATSATTNGYGTITAVVSGDTDFVTYGMYLVDPAININDPNNATGGGGALISELDVDDLGAGFMAPQTATALANVNNGVGFSGDSNAGDLSNSTGQVVFDASGNFAGTANLNDLNPATPSATETSAATVTGMSTADAVNVGRYTDSITVNGAATPSSQVSYVVSGLLGVTVDVDSNVATGFAQVGSGETEGQQ